MSTPTVQPPQPATLSSSLKRNIEALAERRRQEAASATRQERLAEAITAFTGSMMFVYLHLALYSSVDRPQPWSRPGRRRSSTPPS